MDLFATLIRDHRHLLKQFKRLKARDMSEPDGLPSSVDNLLFHMELEETFLFPPLQEVKKANPSLEKALKEHNAIKILIEKLFRDQQRSDRLQTKVEDFLDSKDSQEAISELFQGSIETQKVQDKISVLEYALQRHFSWEEAELFPLAARLLPLDKKNSIYNAIYQEKRTRKQEQIA